MNDYQALAAPVLVVFTALMAVLFGWLLRGVVDGWRMRRIVAKYAAPLRPVHADRDRSDEPTGV